jgi:hypothetical protein
MRERKANPGLNTKRNSLDLPTCMDLRSTAPSMTPGAWEGLVSHEVQRQE